MMLSAVVALAVETTAMKNPTPAFADVGLWAFGQFDGL